MRVLLVRLDHMGDIVLTVPPAAVAVRAVCPGARLDVLTTSAGEVLLRDDPNIDGIEVFDAPWSVPPPGRRSTPRFQYLTRCAGFLLRRLWQPRSRYDVVLFLSFSPWERILLWRRGKYRAGFAGPYRRRLFRLSTRLLDEAVPFGTSRHVLDNVFDLIRSVFPDVRSDNRTRLAVSENRRNRGRQLLEEVAGGKRPWVVIHAGTDESMKSWPFAKYLDVAARLEDECGANVVVVGSNVEMAFYRRMMQGDERRMVHLLATPDVSDLVSVLANADLFIGNDGGPAHIAAALDVPTVAVFGPTDENVYGPREGVVRIVRESGICGRRQYPWQVDSCCRRKDRECLNLIRVESVLEAARDMLRDHHGRRLSRAAVI